MMIKIDTREQMFYNVRRAIGTLRTNCDNFNMAIQSFQFV